MPYATSPLGLNSALGPPAALQIVLHCRILVRESETHLTRVRNGLCCNVRRSKSSFLSSYVAETEYRTLTMRPNLFPLQQNPQAQTPVHFGCVATGDSAAGGASGSPNILDTPGIFSKSVSKSPTEVGKVNGKGL
jgi:hypothetical protein